MIEPSNIMAAAGKKEYENLKFRAYLKNRADPDVLDRQFLELHNELFTGYDCRKCNNCCRAYNPVVQEDEIDSISTFLGVTGQDFSDKYLVQTNEGYEIKSPCCFLNANGECLIQECKPAKCRDFPFTDKPDRVSSLLGVVSFAEVCPVVFEIVERLKKIYRFKTRQ